MNGVYAPVEEGLKILKQIAPSASLPAFPVWLYRASARGSNYVSKKTNANKAEDPPDFEKALTELEQIVERMEQGELSLDESLKQFERGIALTRSCQTALQQAEQKVEILLRKSGGAEPFVTDEFSSSVKLEGIENASDNDD